MLVHLSHGTEDCSLLARLAGGSELHEVVLVLVELDGIRGAGRLSKLFCTVSLL